MEIISYIAYGTLIILAIVWSVDVRNDLGAGKPAILRAAYFILAAIFVPLSGINLGHCLWLAPFGCLFARLIAPTLIKIPVVSLPFIVIADIFERMIHIGIPRQKIQQAQSDSTQACEIAHAELKEVGDKS